MRRRCNVFPWKGGAAVKSKTTTKHPKEMTNLLIAITAYCHCAICCGVAGQPTASGHMPREGITVAAPRRIPFGTRIYIPGIGWRVAQDRAHARHDETIDVFVKSHAKARNMGRKTQNVWVVMK